jgi:ferredoxin
MKLQVDYESCEANGVCAAFAPDVFELDDDDHLHIRSQPTPENIEQVRHAVLSCPRVALTLTEDDVR